MFSIENYNKPANKKWKFWSKFLTRTLPVYAGIIAAMPNSVLTADAKIWIATGISAIVATISGLSEFTTEEQADNEQETNLDKEENEQNKTEEAR